MGMAGKGKSLRPGRLGPTKIQKCVRQIEGHDEVATQYDEQ